MAKYDENLMVVDKVVFSDQAKSCGLCPDFSSIEKVENIWGS